MLQDQPQDQNQILWNLLKEEAINSNTPAWALAERIRDPYIADDEEVS